MSIVDHQAHWYPPELYEALARRSVSPRVEKVDSGYIVYQREGAPGVPAPRSHYRLQSHFDSLRKLGVDAIVSSASPLAEFADLEVSEARELATVVNEAYARAQRASSGRLIGLATLPMGDAGTAIEVLDDAVLRLGLRGVALGSNVAGKPLVSDATWPVWERINALGVPVVLHPVRSIPAPAFDALGPHIDLTIGWVFDTSAAVLSLVYSGALDSLPRLEVLLPHVGGILPYIVGRLQLAETFVSSRASEPALHYLRTRIFVDTVTNDAAALRLALDVLGPERAVFGSDAPYLSREDQLSRLRHAVPQGVANQILERTLSSLETE